MKDGSLGFLAPEPLGEQGPDLHYFFLGDDAFDFMPWIVKPYSRRQVNGRKNSKLFDLQRQEGV